MSSSFCGDPHPDEPGTTCTYPRGHGLVWPDLEHDPGHTMQHGAPEEGAWWSYEAVFPATLTLEATVARVREFLDQYAAFNPHGGEAIYGGSTGLWLRVDDLQRLLATAQRSYQCT